MSISRRQLVSSAAIGLACSALAPISAFASKKPGTEELRTQTQGSNVHKRPPRIKVLLTNPETGKQEPIDSDRLNIVSSITAFDEATSKGSNSYEFEFSESFNQSPSNFPGISLLDSTGGNTSDVVVKISVTAYWTRSGAKIKLTKVKHKITLKMGSFTKRGLLYCNADHRKRRTNIPLAKTYDVSWGYQPYDRAHADMLHFVNLWGTAKADGMGGSRDVSCLITYGD